MDLIRNFLHVLTKKELRIFLYACAAIAVAIVLRSGIGIQEHSSFVPVKGGELREGMVGQPIFVNPVFSENQVDQDISALVFSPLKDISTYINADEENKVFTVSLREDLRWDDGTPVTSDDVIFTIKTAQDPEARSPIAKNWSGAAVERPRGIALAVADAGGSVELIEREGGWSRLDILHWLEDQARARRDMLIGFDLSPTLPFIDAGAYFPGWADSPATPRDLWALVDRIAAHDPWLVAPSLVDHPDLSAYFRRHGGREGMLFGGGLGRLRAVEHRQRETRQAFSASCFNLVGAAQVGKASLSGMRLFHRLADRIPFWPFDPVPDRGPCIIEIYTSIATRAAGRPGNRSKIRDAATLYAALAHFGARLLRAPRRLDDHATDALVTAAWMRRSAADSALWRPAAMGIDAAQREGWTFGVF